MSDKKQEIVPRIRGRVVPREGGGFTYLLYINIGSQNIEDAIVVGPRQDVPYLTELAAKNALTAATADMLQIVSEVVTGKKLPIASVIDLNQGVVKTLEEFVKPQVPATPDQGGGT
jgi:hypothetical protein